MAAGNSFFSPEMLKQLREGDHQARLKLVEQLAQAYDHNFYTRQEQHIADDILRLLVKDKHPDIRQKLADILKSNLLLPQEIILTLAMDELDPIACPVLQHSYLLSEKELVELVSGSVSTPRLQAIAQRETLSAELSDALMDQRQQQVLHTLFANSGAQLAESSIERVLSELPADEKMLGLLSQRSELSHELKEHIADTARKAGLTSFTTQSMAEETLPEVARIYSLLGMTAEQVRGNGLAQLVYQLHQQGRITISLLLRALCIGELALVEHALGRMAGIPVGNVRILLRDKGGRGVSALYQKAGLPDSFSSVFCHLVTLLLNDPTLSTLHPRLLKRHLLIAIQHDDPEAVEYTTAIIEHAAQDLEEAERRFATGKPLAEPE